MKRFSARLIGPLMLGMAAVAVSPSAGAATVTRRAVVPDVVAGNYTVYLNFNGHGYQPFTMTLYRDHTGIDQYGSTIVWSLNLRAFHMTFNTTQIWDGKKKKTGFSSLAHRGSRRPPNSVAASGTRSRPDLP
jgi:hypothetical protein